MRMLPLGSEAWLPLLLQQLHPVPLARAGGTHQTCGSANQFEPSARAFNVPLLAHASRKRPAPHAIRSRASSVMTMSVNMSTGHVAMQPAHAANLL